MTEEIKKAYLQILKEELVPAMGCTEPIAIAYASAKAFSLLGEKPQEVHLEVSGNLVKNAKSVTVPHTGGLKGLQSAVAAGVIAGNPEGGFGVLLGDITEDQLQQIKSFLHEVPISVDIPENASLFDIRVSMKSKNHSSSVRVLDTHINIVRMEKDEKTLFDQNDNQATIKTDKSILNVQDIYDYACHVDLDEVRPILERQIEYNMAIAEEGLKNNYGASIGQVLIHSSGEIQVRARAYAAAASDARMSGCEMPVVINSGSGNQGISASVPVIVYGRYWNVPHEKLLRALCISNLLTLHVKAGIGTLSAYCGAVAAGAGAGCGICFLDGGDETAIAHTLVNALAIDSGMICDGAKASCAAKIATAVENGILGYLMYKEKKEFFGGDGIVKKGVENTIASISRLANQGMVEADKVILDIMLDKE